MSQSPKECPNLLSSSVEIAIHSQNIISDTVTVALLLSFYVPPYRLALRDRELRADLPLKQHGQICFSYKLRARKTEFDIIMKKLPYIWYRYTLIQESEGTHPVHRRRRLHHAWSMLIAVA